MTAVSVTAEHIAEGARQDAERCAIALALRDALPDIEYIGVSGESVALWPRTSDPWTEENEIAPPFEVVTFIKAFDNDLPVEPFTFELDYPAGAQ
jgi:hypothetical protein